MADPITKHTARARWGLLLITIVTAIGLVAAAWVSYGVTTEAADAVTRARAADLLRVVRRALRVRGDRGAALAEVVDEFADQGLRYVAVVRRGVLWAEAGERVGADPTRAQPPPPPPGPGPGAPPRLTAVGDRVRVIAPLRFGRGPHMGWGGLAVLELEPVRARSMTRGALTLLVASVVAAIVLLLGALVFGRLAARAARAEAQLARDRRLAALGEMSAVLGHELRNPLAALKGHAQLVAERLEEGHRAEKNAARVVKEAERLELLTGQILDFARTGEIDRRPTDPRRPVDAAIASLDAADAVTVRADDAPERWAFDADRLTQVLTNVLKNALQASPHDRPVEVTVRREREGLVYEVRDHGPGLPPGEAELLFEPFRTHRVRGTGLGLAIARRIVEAHGGIISAANHPEGGARVRLVIPAHDDDDAHRR